MYKPKYTHEILDLGYIIEEIDGTLVSRCLTYNEKLEGNLRLFNAIQDVKQEKAKALPSDGTIMSQSDT